jgi:hypothetical protein
VAEQARDVERQVNDQMKTVEDSLNQSILASADSKEAEAIEASKPFVPPNIPPGG